MSNSLWPHGHMPGMPGLPVHHHLLEFTQTQVHWLGDAIQPSHPLSSLSPPTFNLSQHHKHTATAAAAKSLQSCPTLCDPIDGSPPGSPVPGILQARTLGWVAISFSNAWKWKVKGSHPVMSDSSRPHGLQPTRLLRPWDFPGKSTGVGAIAFSISEVYFAINTLWIQSAFLYLKCFYWKLIFKRDSPWV